jgi:hypothetical protein
MWTEKEEIMARYRVSYEKTTGNGRPSKSTTEVNVNSQADARAKVLSMYGSASNVKVKIISVVPVK